MFEEKAVEIAIGQIRGLVLPTKAEREAAFELFVELASRTTTTPLTEETGLIREALDSLYKMFDLTRSILRAHGHEVAGGRSDGNLTLAELALRVLNEIIRPRTSKWHPLLLSYEAGRPDSLDNVEWEKEWSEAADCRSDLNALRTEIRAYMDSLAQIAGASSLTDLVVPVAPSAPIRPVHLAGPAKASFPAKPREKMVRWFDPVDGAKILLATRRGDPKRTGRPKIDWSSPIKSFKSRRAAQPRAFSNAGRRPAGNNEVTKVQVPTKGDGSLWFDYVSDLGDGFDPTAAMAWQLTRPHICLPADPYGELPTPPEKLERGQLLVMGGDEVYPFATKEVYQQQCVLPYELAANAEVDDVASPALTKLVAIPGNHDWIGGIEHFEQVFVKEKEFATRWETPQTERWWVVELSHGWWMWGIDTALNDTLDDHQLAYFEKAAKELNKGDRVILCTPVPFWQLRQKREKDYDELRRELDHLVEDQGATIPLFLAGDSHFFAHYQRVDGYAEEDHITAGGGGAFMQPTHNLPEQIPFEKGAAEFKITRRWPRSSDSRLLASGIGGLKDSQFLLVFLIAGLFHAGYAALVATAFEAGDQNGTWWSTAGETLTSVLTAKLGWIILALIAFAMVKGTLPNSGESQLQSGAKRYGSIHGLAQVALMIAVATAVRLIDLDPSWLLLYVVAPLVGGVLMTALLVAITRWLNSTIKANDTPAFSSSYLTRYKNFIRMRIDVDGALSVWVIGVDPVGKGWFKALTEGTSVPPFDPAGASRLHYVWGKTFAASD